MWQVRGSTIGGVGTGGISGGERRRLSIACELLLDSSLLLVDEAVTGLDSFMAESVIDLLYQLSRAGRTVLATVHQPAAEMLARFDALAFMSDGEWWWWWWCV